MLPPSRRPFGHWGICSFAALTLLTAQQTYDRLKNHADTYGYCTLSEQERFFLKKFKAMHLNPLVREGAKTTGEALKHKKQRTWTGASPSVSPKRRRVTRRARVSFAPSLKTWTPPAAPEAVQAMEGHEVVASLPAHFQRPEGKRKARVLR